jgi:integrase/recombinase XerC
MGLGKQAKVLSDRQVRTALAYISENHRYPLRDRVMALLSVKAGLRAKEVAGVTWAMAMDADGQVGDVLELRDGASKGKRGGRTIPLNNELRAALVELHAEQRPAPADRIIRSERGAAMLPGAVANWFGDLYRKLGFAGASSHSGRRTFVTKAAKRCVEAGGSLRDVQQLAGHSSLAITQRYIEGSTEAKRKLVNML